MRIEGIRAAVLAWYRPRRHAYAWRRGRRSPYRTLVSEVMLQQTQAARVEPPFRAFLARFPDVATLATASRAEVLRAWSGLGYNRRAVALHEAARTIVREHRGRVPRDLDALRRLPGVGPYTAAAVASIGHGEPVAAVDTNVRRICARAIHGAEPDELPASVLSADADRWLDRSDPGAWNQALMDLGRFACRAEPRCDDCPLSTACRFRAAGRTARPSRRRQPPFEGSARQVRGAVVRFLRGRGSATERTIARRTGHPPRDVRAAVAALVAEGLLDRVPSGAARLAMR
ncbi:MAG TPA: A/G-specific adenine glycosylase [Actinomycetota bacterium]|nr:A/G-specific adenine glycosylase [Actinomycetota bacterium]